MKRHGYSLREIKRAFWKNFHKSGENWFDYLSSERDCVDSTKDGWRGFLESLHATDKEPDVAELAPQENGR